MPITRNQLDQAIANVLGADVAAAMSAAIISRPAMHKEAISKAFVYGCSDEDAAILREAQIMLDTNAAYDFAG